MSILSIMDEIEKERIKKKLSVKQLCFHAGVARNNYSRWRNGRMMPTLGPLSCLLDVLNLEIEVVRHE